MPRPRLLAVLLLALLALLARPASVAGASTYSQVLNAYQLHGSVPPCQFSSPQLEHALRAIDTYGAQYFQDFATAIQNALSTRASGGCAPAPKRPVSGAGGVSGAAVGGGPSQAVPGGGGPRGAGSSPPLALGPVSAATQSSLPAPILLLAGLAALFGLIASGAGLARWRGWSPGWGASWAHAWSEAGYRSEGRLLEFTDWLRSGSG